MVKLHRLIGSVVLTTILGTSLVGCTSIKIPDFDFIKFPEFKEEATNIPDYPKVANAPKVPTDIRSAEAWDLAAQNVLTKRDGFVDPEEVGAMSDAEVLREMQRLRAEADEYKKDDPK